MAAAVATVVRRVVIATMRFLHGGSRDIRRNNNMYIMYVQFPVFVCRYIQTRIPTYLPTYTHLPTYLPAFDTNASSFFSSFFFLSIIPSQSSRITVHVLSIDFSFRT